MITRISVYFSDIKYDRLEDCTEMMREVFVLCEQYWSIIPVAGRSRRMEHFKPLLPWPQVVSETTVIESTVQTLLNAGIQKILVVTGHRASEVEQVLARWNVRMLRNPDPDQPNIQLYCYQD